MIINDNRPGVFISSTTSDFIDLRSSLGYYLEKSGYRVYMSETSTFPVNPNKSNFEQCFELINQCQYYILLIGYKRGSWYKHGVSTITQQEFRHARSKFEKTGDISLLTFIRDDVWSIVSEYKRSGGIYKPKIMEDTEFTERFINEVTRDEDFSEAQQQGRDFPRTTWVSRFNRFSDIIDVLSITMNIETNRRMEILRSLAINELQENIRACFDDYTATKKAYPFYIYLEGIIASKIMKGLTLPAGEVKNFAALGVLALDTNRFKLKAVQELLSSGELLDYDINSRRYKKSPVMKIAEVMIKEVNRLQNFFENQVKYSEWMPQLKGLSMMARRMDNKELIEIPEDLFLVLWMLGRTKVIFNNAWHIYQFLRYPEKDFSKELSQLGPESYHLLTVSGEKVEPVPLEKVQEWFENQGRDF
ncbi:DUF4062 domain-containing protein [Priestia aryabhattai]|uniref:DUF4062 domain-containing protein n=1 Tax=Priestia aryabhattai TaxID=412384 RepID=UPI001CFEFB38|nr:DUF4062 domain-containing protein [Priestia aryabhattai]